MEQRKALIKGIKKIVIKIGSAVLTDNGVLHRPAIARLADDIAFLRKKGYQTAIVSSGAIASGVGKMGLSRKPVTIPQKQAVAAVGQGSLMYAYEEAFNTHQLLVAQILLTREDLTNRQRYLNARNTLITLLEWGIIPIINENDTVAVDEIKFGDNDNLSALIAHLIESDLLIVLTDTEGLYDRDPREDPKARLIPVVEHVDGKVVEYTSKYSGAVGFGRDALQDNGRSKGHSRRYSGHCRQWKEAGCSTRDHQRETPGYLFPTPKTALKSEETLDRFYP